LSPARSAVNGDVLVLGPRNIVTATDVSPIPTGGEILGLNVSPREITALGSLTGVLEEVNLSATLGASLGHKIF